MEKKTAHHVLPPSVQAEVDKGMLKTLIENNDIDYVVDFLYELMGRMKKYNISFDDCLEELIKEREIIEND